MPFADAVFDAAFSVEATVHAPKLELVYGEIFRVLKPGGKYACYEWCVTESYDENDPKQKKVIHGIEVHFCIFDLALHAFTRHLCRI